MINKEDKKAVIQELQKEIYRDYVKSKAVYKFLTTHYAKDLAEDEDKIRQDLKDVRNLAKEESEKEKKDEGKLKEFAVKISNLEGRIDFVGKKKEEIKQIEFRINELVDYENYFSDDKEIENLIRSQR